VKEYKVNMRPETCAVVESVLFRAAKRELASEDPERQFDGRELLRVIGQLMDQQEGGNHE